MATYYLLTPDIPGEPETVDDNELNQHDRMQCPYCGNDNNAFALDADKGCYQCFACQKKGKALTAQEYRSYKSKNFCKSLNGNTGLEQWLREGDSCQDAFGDKPVPSKSSVEKPKKQVDFTNVIREHIYKDEDGKPVSRKVYYGYKNADGKLPIQHRWEDGQWKPGLTYEDGSQVPQLLYNLPSLVNSKSHAIFLVEGEKDVDTLIKHGCRTATTLGSANAELKFNHLKYFRDKAVYIIPDDDRAGYEFCRQTVKTLLLNGITNIHIVQLSFDEPNEGSDISDYLQQHPCKPDQLPELLWNHQKPVLECLDDLNKYSDSSEPLLDFEQLYVGHRKFPVDILPVVIRDYALAHSKIDNSSIEYHCLGAMTGAGSLVGEKYNLTVHGSWKANTTMCIALVGHSGQSKSHPLSGSLNNINDLNRQYHEQYKSAMKDYERYQSDRLNRKTNNSAYSGDKLEKPSYQPYIIHKFTLEGLRNCLVDNPRGILLYVDELRGLFQSLNQYKGGKGDDLEVLMGLIDGQDRIVKLAKEETFIKSPRISIIGTIQTKVLKKCFKGDYCDNGFAYRFLFSCPDKRLFTLNDIDDKAQRQIQTTKGNLKDLIIRLDKVELNVVDGINEPIQLKFGSDAKAHFMRFINSTCHTIDTYFDNSLLSEILSKIRTYFPKLALLTHLIRYHSKETDQLDVDITSVKVAEQLAMYFLYHNYMALKSTGDKQTDVYLSKINAYMAKNELDTISIRELYRYKVLGKNMGKADAVRSVIDSLVEQGKVKYTNSQKATIKLL